MTEKTRVGRRIRGRRETVISFDRATHGSSLDDVCGWAEARRDELQRALAEHGVIALRGFPLGSAEAFERFAMAIDPDACDYRGQTVRARVHGRVYEATPIPGRYPIPMHSETAYASYFPARGFFYCETPATRGGETLFADNRAILAALPREVAAAFRARGVRYLRTLPPSSAWPVRLSDALGAGIFKSWQAAFETDVPAEVEAFCSIHGLPFAWEADWLNLSARLPATRHLPDTGEEVWFNQAHIFHVSRRTHDPITSVLNRAINAACRRTLFGVTYGDGGALDDDTMVGIKRTMERHAWAWSWHAGDVVYFDNLRVAHGRAPFTGARTIFTLWTGYPRGASA